MIAQGAKAGLLGRLFAFMVVTYAACGYVAARVTFQFWRGVTRALAYGAYRSGRRALDARLNLRRAEKEALDAGV